MKGQTCEQTNIQAIQFSNHCVSFNVTISAILNKHPSQIKITLAVTLQIKAM